MGDSATSSAIQAAYQQAAAGTGRPHYMTIWCPYCHHEHYGTLNTNNVCARLMNELAEARERAAVFNAARGEG